MSIKVTTSSLITWLVVLLAIATGASGQVPDGTVAVNDSSGRAALENEDIKSLREEIQVMQRQIEELKAVVRNLVEARAAVAEAGELSAARDSVVEVKEPAPAAERPERQEKREIGVDLGHARLTPYGSIYFNAFSNSGGTNNADVPLFATPSGRGGTGASLRQTRLGFRLDRFSIAGANAAAVLEADFFGGFPSVGIGENFGIVRLRLANVKLNWERTSLTVGQDWSLFAPSNPTSLAAAAIPQMAAAGNNWARLPQVKIEQTLGSGVTAQFAVAAQQTGDSATNVPFFLQPNSGSAARVPFFQGRIGYSATNVLGSGRQGFIALSGHYGRSRVFVGAATDRYEVDSVGLAADWNVPIHKRFWLNGEAFFGRNLQGFQGGIFQGYNTDFAYRQGDTLIPAGVRAIGTRGGWIQVGFTPDVFRDRLSLYGSFGIDDPRNGDLVTSVPRDLRSRNLAFAFDTIYRVSSQFSLGAEYRRFQTTWTNSGRQNGNHVNLAAVYSF
jgi:hypothetical protein